MHYIHTIGSNERSAKHVLYHIFKQIVDFKKSDGGKSSMEAVAQAAYGANSDGMAVPSNGSGMAVVEAVPIANSAQVLQNIDMNATRGRTQLTVRKYSYIYIILYIYIYVCNIYNINM